MTTATANRLDPEAAIDDVTAITRRIDEIRAHLADEADDAAEHWAGLVALGAGRADHAATLLGRLRPHLEDLESFSAACRQQLDGMVADPFGRDA